MIAAKGRHLTQLTTSQRLNNTTQTDKTCLRQCVCVLCYFTQLAVAYHLNQEVDTQRESRFREGTNGRDSKGEEEQKEEKRKKGIKKSRRGSAVASA